MRGNSRQIDQISFSFQSMEQDTISISWKDLPWKKFQKKSFRLQCKIYKAKQSNNPKLVRRLQKLLINSKSLYYLTIRKVSQILVSKGLFFSDDRKLLLVEEMYSQIRNKKYKFAKLSTKFKGFRKVLNLSLFRHKVIESVWKFVTAPVCIKNFISLSRKYSPDLSRRFAQEFTLKPHYQNKKILSLSMVIDMTSINFNALISDLWLPSRYKTELYKLLERFSLKMHSSYKDIVLMFIHSIFSKIEGLSDIYAETSTDLIFSYKYKTGFHLDIQGFYFFKKNQNFAYIYPKILALLQCLGIGINLSKVSLKEVKSDFTFLYSYMKSSRDGNILIFPSSTYWYFYKKRIMYILNQEQISWYLRVKKLKLMLMIWAQSNDYFSRVEAKSRFFYLKKSLAKSN